MSTIDRILQLVDESGLTAKEYAINAGLGAGNITDWKTGRSKPSVESLQKIAKYAGVQLEWLTGDSEYKTKIDFLRAYNKDLYNFDVNTALSTALLHSIAHTESNFIEFIDDIQDFLDSKRGVFLITENDINIFLEKYPENKKKQVENSLRKIISDLKHAQDNRDAYASLASSALNEKFRIYKCPVYGNISAGQPNWAEECLEGYLPIDPNLMNIINPEECFFLRVNGESMNKVVRNGAYALIRKQDIVENGEIAAVLVNGYDATLKKFTQHNDVIVLEPISDDPSFQTQIYDKNTEIKILGKYIGKFEINN